MNSQKKTSIDPKELEFLNKVMEATIKDQQIILDKAKAIEAQEKAA